VSADRGRRDHAFGQGHELSVVDRLGNWLSWRSLRRHVGHLDARRVADIGCGFDARLTAPLVDRVAELTLVDVALNPSLKANARVTPYEGQLPEVLTPIPSGSIDVTLCISVLEHVWDDRTTLAELRRITARDGLVMVNVPSWLGKRALEFSAFRLGLSPRAEMDDHKRYYDPRDLWPLLVEAGFVPFNITCRRHKFGLNTLAVCRMSA
jgi:SAM-dependent methyltransferase